MHLPPGKWISRLNCSLLAKRSKDNTKVWEKFTKEQQVAISTHLQVHESDLFSSVKNAGDIGCSSITDGLLLGNMLEACCLPFLQHLGVTHVCCVAFQVDPAFP